MQENSRNVNMSLVFEYVKILRVLSLPVPRDASVPVFVTAYELIEFPEKRTISIFRIAA
jgi:hypothetical protein